MRYELRHCFANGACVIHGPTVEPILPRPGGIGALYLQAYSRKPLKIGIKSAAPLWSRHSAGSVALYAGYRVYVIYKGSNYFDFKTVSTNKRIIFQVSIFKPVLCCKPPHGEVGK